jgi:hypothetical protein
MRRSNALTIGLGVLAFAFSVVLYYPGYLSFDSAYQYWQVRTGQVSNQSPVAMIALWQLVDALWPAPAAMLVLHFAAYWTGLVLLALQFWPSLVPRIVFLLGVGFLPPTFVIMGHVWTDVSLIAAMTLAFGLTVTGALRRRPVALVLALPVIVYTGVVRYNALLAILPLATLWAWSASDAWRRRRGAGASAVRGLAVAALAVTLVGGSFAFGRVLDQRMARERVATWTLVALWDLAAMSVRTDTMLVPEFARTPGLTLETLRRDYTPLVNVPIFSQAQHVRHGLDDERFSAEELDRLRDAWLRTIAAHPLAYAQHRWDVSSHLFGRFDSGLEGLFFTPAVVAYKDNPPPPPALSNLRDRLAAVVRATRGWLVFVPAIYLALAAGVAAWAWRQRASLRGRIALCIAGSGLLLVLPLAIAAPSAELRYSGWLFAASLIALAACTSRNAAGERMR